MGKQQLQKLNIINQSKTPKNINKIHNLKFKLPDTQKIQLKLAINFMSSRDTDKENEMYSRSNNIESMINDKAPFEFLLSRYQISIEKQ